MPINIEGLLQRTKGHLSLDPAGRPFRRNMAERTWSPYQRAIFDDVANGEGHTVVQARAGSGKTTTILEAMRYIPSAKSAIFMAFNKSIAEELSNRAPKGVAVSTLHSYGNRAVANAYGKLQINGRRVENLAAALVGDERAKWEQRRALAKAVSLCKNLLVGEGEGDLSPAQEIDALIDQWDLDTANIDRSRFIDLVIRLLEQSKSVSDGQIDFDDMIWLPVVNKLRVYQYDRVFIDELQDLNPCQFQLVKRSVKKGGRLCGVGDDRQSIYQFRGADRNSMARFVAEFGAKVLPLSITYRCPRQVVELAKEIVPDLEAAPGAKEGRVGEATVEQMLKAVAPGDFILSRTNAPLAKYCMALLRSGKPAFIQGRDIGSSLIAFVRNAQAGSVEGLRAHITRWREAELKRLSEKKDVSESAMEAVEDKALTLLHLTVGMPSVEAVMSRIEQLFADQSDARRITLSSTHKAKGLERDRVWMLTDTYRRRPGVEEENLYYVAVTRSKDELFLVRQNGGQAYEEEEG
jgi:DNA helicase-2/ATP-dependent DNA helicase PcrA